MRQEITTARPTSAPSMTLMSAFVIVFFVIVLARCATIARRIVVCKDSGNVIIKILVIFEVILRDVFAVFISQDKARELQPISVIERILCAEIVFASFVCDVVFECIHIFYQAKIP